MRRLPVYLVLDTSGSMRGEPIKAIQSGVQSLVSSLRQDPYALETVFLSIITFGTNAEQILPLTDIFSLKVPDLHAEGTTSLGKAFLLLSEKLKSEVVKSTYETKGDWMPLVFIMTDGGPTGAWINALKELKTNKTGITVVCALGKLTEKHKENLKRISEIVLNLNEGNEHDIKQFFKWVSASVSAGSKRINNNEELSDCKELPQIPPGICICL